MAVITSASAESDLLMAPVCAVHTPCTPPSVCARGGACASVCLIHQSMNQSVNLSINQSFYLCIYVSVNLSINQSFIYVSMYLSVCLPTILRTHPPYLVICRPIYHGAHSGASAGGGHGMAWRVTRLVPRLGVGAHKPLGARQVDLREMGIYTYTYINMYTHIYIHTHTHTHTHAHTHTHKHTHTWPARSTCTRSDAAQASVCARTLVRVHARACACVRACACSFARACVRARACMCVFAFVRDRTPLWRTQHARPPVWPRTGARREV
jgi:hypothetical protein